MHDILTIIIYKVVLHIKIPLVSLMNDDVNMNNGKSTVWNSDVIVKKSDRKTNKLHTDVDEDKKNWCGTI